MAKIEKREESGPPLFFNFTWKYVPRLFLGGPWAEKVTLSPKIPKGKSCDTPQNFPMGHTKFLSWSERLWHFKNPTCAWCTVCTSSWPSLWSWTLPPSFPALYTSWDWFLPFVSHFDLPGPRYAVAKAQSSNFGDSSHTVWPATWVKSVEMSKTCSPWNRHFSSLVMGKKITFCPLWPKWWGFKVKSIKKYCKSTIFWGRFEVTMGWPWGMWLSLTNVTNKEEFN